MQKISKPKVLLVGWDAADWEHITPLLDQGLLPTLESLINQGSMGNLRTLQPVLSPMLWNSIATGKQAHKHGVHGFVEPDLQNGGARPWSSCSRKCKALWNILSQNGFRCNVINWWASHPAEPINGCVVTNLFNGVKFDPKSGWKIGKGTVHPERLAMQLAPNKVFPNELAGEQILPFVPNGKDVKQDDDRRISTVATNLAEMLSTHSVATAVMELEPWDFTAVYYTAIDHFSHAFMYYHPPKLPWVPKEDFEMFKDVINGAYRFSDMTLHRLIQMAGPDATVILCSDHGFQSRELRPRHIPNEPAAPAWWHRRFGIFLAKGPGIKADDRVYGASLLDVAPTILSIFGLPIGKDMDGRVLAEIFEQPPEIKTISSWENVSGESGMHAGEVATDPEEAEELLNQFAALGYIESPSDSKEEQAEMADIEAKYNLARNLMSCDRPQDATDIFLELVHRSPWESRFIILLAKSLLAIRRADVAERLITNAYDIQGTSDPAARLLWGEIKLAMGERNAAIDALHFVERAGTGMPEQHLHVGTNYLKLRKFADAERAFLAAIKIHADSAEAYQGLATVCLRRGDNQGAVDNALAAIGLVYGLPRSHLILGIALARSQESDGAIAALKTAINFNPLLVHGHRFLNYVYKTLKKDSEKAAHHRSEVIRLRPKNRTTSPVMPIRFSVDIALPEFPSEKDRAEILAKKRPSTGQDAKKSGKCFVLVSGLPRSGTSLMMQMLEAGGLLPKTDGERTADIDNPKGYYEWEAIKTVQRHPEIMDESDLDRKAIKVISMLLPQMPYRHEYKVIFMTRPIEEVINSQSAMIRRLNTEGAKLDDRQLSSSLVEHREFIVQWLQGHPRAKCLFVDFPDLIANPGKNCAEIAEFLGAELLPNPEKMAPVIDSSLYRNRTDQIPPSK